MKKTRYQVGIVIIMMVVLVVGANHADNVIKEWRDSQIVSKEGDICLWKQGIIEYKGKKYQYKSNIKTYLLMGIDSMEPVSVKEGTSNGGQADALFLLIVDDENKDWSIMAINRNTMTNVDIYDENGILRKQRNAQICVQHGFGDGMEESCVRTIKKVSETLFNMPLDGYFSINMGALPEMNDALGGITLESMDTIDIPDVVHVDKGETITLQGMQAWSYLVWRDTSQVDSATQRLERQKQYIQAVYNKINSSDVNKLKLLSETIDIVDSYTVMDIPVLELAYQIISYDKNIDEIYSLPGTETVGDRFVEYYMDEEAARDMLISLYYEEVE